MPKNTCWAPDEVSEAHALFSALPGYPFLPCPICVGEGFKGMDGCDHTALERAQATHPGFTLTAPPTVSRCVVSAPVA